MNNSDDVAEFKKITIPTVRRCSPELIASQISAVQPIGSTPDSMSRGLIIRLPSKKTRHNKHFVMNEMSSPSGMIFYLRSKNSPQQKAQLV